METRFLLLVAIVAMLATSLAQATIAENAPLFTASSVPPGTTKTSLYCDGVITPKKDVMTGNVWQSTTLDWPVGTHTCFASAYDAADVKLGDSNQVAFAITPPPVVPPVLDVGIAAGSPIFNWSAYPDATEYRLKCDGISTAFYKGPALTWTAPVGTFSVGPHSCYVLPMIPTGSGPVSNTVNFTIPPAVVPPPVLTVE